MNGCAGLSMALRRLEGAETERRHKLGFAILNKTHKPLVFCFACGAYTSRRCYLLGQNCLGKLGTSGESVLSRIQAGHHPHYRKNPEGDDSLAPARAPPKSVLLAPPGPLAAGTSRLVDSDRLRALAARIQAKEEASRR